MENHHNICPICNGLITLQETCPNCKEITEETTNPDTIYDPYAPYESQDIFYNDLQDNQHCIHQVLCPNCGNAWNISVNKVDL